MGRHTKFAESGIPPDGMPCDCHETSAILALRLFVSPPQTAAWTFSEPAWLRIITPVHDGQHPLELLDGVADMPVAHDTGFGHNQAIIVGMPLPRLTLRDRR